MSLVEINGVDVIGGSIAMPRVGVWSADLIIDQPDGEDFDAGTDVSITTGSLTLAGRIAPNRSGDFLDAMHVRVLGGKGGLGTMATARSYVQPGARVSDVLDGLMTASGESLSSTIDPAFLSTSLTAWSVFNASCSEALKLLLDTIAPTYSWRILADGTLWVGVETWTDSAADFDIIENDPADGTYELGVETPSIVPGVTLADVGRVDRVEHLIGKSDVRSRVWTAGEEERGLKRALSLIVEHAIAGVDYLGKYDARVVSQSADGATVDVQPIDTRLPGYGKVPLRLGLPGCVAKFAAGAVVRLAWDRGDPSRPYACLFDSGATLTTLEIGGAGAQFVALSNLVATEFGKVKTTLDSLSGATFTTPYAAPASVAATKVKAV